MRTRILRVLPCLAVPLVMFACSGAVDPADDAGEDGAADAVDAWDAGADPGVDAGQDAGSDPGSDPGFDAGSDPGADAGSDPGADPGADAGADPGADAVAFCPDIPGAVVLSRPGLFFEASAAEPTRTLMAPCGANEIYARIVLEYDFYHAGFYEPDPAGAHGLFQLTRGTVWRSNLYGFLTVRGPPSNLVRVISNIDLAAGEVVRLQTNAWLPADHLYHLRYTYDASVSQRHLLITRGGETVVDIADGQAASEIRTLAPGFELILATDLACEGCGPEVPMHGWTFSDLCLQVLP